MAVVGLTGTEEFQKKLIPELQALGLDWVPLTRGVSTALEAAVPAAALHPGDWIVFTSAKGVCFFFDRLTRQGDDTALLHRCRFAVIGAETGKALASFGFTPELCPARYTSQAMTQALMPMLTGRETVWLFCSAQGSHCLEEAVPSCRRIELYSTAFAPAAEMPVTDYVLFGSAAGVRSLHEAGYIPAPGTTPLCIGPVCAAEYRRCCGTEPEQSQEATVRSLAHRLNQLISQQSNFNRNEVQTMYGIAYGVGVGPGDPEMMTLKAVRVIRENDVIALPGLEPKETFAYKIAVQAVPELADKELISVHMPMTHDKAEQERWHRAGAARMAEYLKQGKNVVYLTLGDSSVYCTFSYLQPYLEADGFQTRLVSGIPSFCAAAARVNVPLGLWNEQIHIMPAVHSLEGQLPETGTCVLMKSGSKMKQVKEQLKASGRDAMMVENCGTADEKVFLHVDDIPDSAGYYSLIIARETK